MSYTDSPLISEADTDTDLKSPVSLAHELALKLNQTVEFALVSWFASPCASLMVFVMTKILVFLFS